MNKCKKCGGEFPNWIKIDGISKNLSCRSYCLKCSPWGKKSAKRLDRFTIINGTKHKKCPVCNTFKSKTEYHFSRAKYWQTACKVCQNERIGKLARDIKQRAVDYKGGKCQDCLVSYPICVYDFHHLDPTQKDFKISGQGIRNMEWNLIQSELDKCVLLCSNCHRLRHYDPHNPGYRNHQNLS